MEGIILNHKAKVLIDRLLIHMEAKGKLNFLDDETYLKLMFWVKMNQKLDLENPTSFNEKLQYLKLYDRKDIYTTMVDKYEAKKFIEKKIGKEYVIPTIGIWNEFDEIEFSGLPNQFVLKTTHDSGGVIICTDKSALDISNAREKLESSLRRNYYWYGREWPYKNVKPRIIAEQYLCEKKEIIDDPAITDYKFFCFDGVPKIMYISRDRAKTPSTDFFDMEFNHLDIRMKDPNAEITPQKPEQFEEMKRIASILSKDISHLRVDFYLISGKLYVGELTFYHNSGFGNVSPDAWNRKLGDWILLPPQNN